MSTTGPKQGSDGDSRSILFNIGAFVGHVRAGWRASVTPSEPRVVARRTSVEEQPLPGTTPQAIARRTVVDEVVLKHEPGPGPGPV
ncbi:MAG: hypothetical protein ACT4PL_13890 [Phycisphaerales bacterium]